MGTTRDVRGFVARLEGRVGAIVSGRDRVALAFSGGLGSTLLAMVARKRCDLVCVVAGTAESRDVRASKDAKTTLDLWVEHVSLDRETVLRHLNELRTSNPTLSARNARALVPLQAILERRVASPVLAGFGNRKAEAAIRAILRARDVDMPLVQIARRRPLPRSLLAEASIALGLPEELARVGPRTPAAGSGIADLLQV